MEFQNLSQRKMQSIKFRTVEEFLDFLPEKELKIVKVLRKIVQDSIPNVIEKLSYNVPYYKVNKNICFIWPASVLWGKKQTYDGVRFGFTNGYLLQDEISYLDKGDRKQVYWKDFQGIKEIDVDLLKSYIYEAVMIDEQNFDTKVHSFLRWSVPNPDFENLIMNDFSLLPGKSSISFTFKSSDYHKLEKGYYDVKFRYSGLSYNVDQYELMYDNGRIWVGDLHLKYDSVKVE